MEGVQFCDVNNMAAGGENFPRILYMEQMPGAANNYFKVESAEFIRFGDGTAKITGVMSHTTNADLAWEFEVHFRNARNWTQWSALGRTYMTSGGGNAYQNLTYYEMDPTQANTFTGIRAYAGSNLTVAHTPGDFMKGFQLGNWGNVFTSDFGFGGWMKYSGQIHYNGQTLNRSNVQADFNLNLGCTEQIPQCADVLVRTCVATDACGNSSSKTQTIVITDDVAPVFSYVPANYTADCEDVLVYETASATDACSNAIVTELPRDTIEGNCVNRYVITRTFRAVDECGNESFAYQTITVVDNTAPTFTYVPANYTASCEETLTFENATATDNCGIANVTESRDTIEGNCANRYLIVRTFTATDLCGNVATSTQTITVVDNTPPVNTNPPANVIVNCGDIIPVYVPTFTDNCDGPIDIQTILPSVIGHCGVEAIETYIATDVCGNQTTVTRTLIFVDEINPTFTSVPADYAASCEETLTYAPAFATDNCGNALVSESRDTTDGVCENEYIIVRTFTATDVCGNTATATQAITITDEIAPTFTFVPANYTEVCSNVLVLAPATATDNCGTASVTEVRYNPRNCPNESSIMRTYTATDLCGNTATTSQTITITDEVAPTFTYVPANYSATCNTTLTFENATATDNCGTASITEARDTIPGNCPNEMSIVRIFTATDLCGNTATATQ
ncbi:MAG: hypothetical protein IPI60_03160 [Saprospiraceae bacterium]|nr:hypothetical protein [Saprospiraceae bacterium]